MDIKTHMMFQDQDIREETQREDNDKAIAIFKYLSKVKAAGDSD